MKSKRTESLPAGIEEVRAGFEEWREQRRRGERIPEALWGAAARAARRHGVHQVSRALGVDYSHLKRRVGQDVDRGHVPGIADAMFVEMNGGPAESGAACVVELEKGNGAKLRVCVGDAGTIDWCRLKEAFLGA